jgi:hypothetical protein
LSLSKKPNRRIQAVQIYFSGSIAGGRSYLDTYIDIVRYLEDRGFTVPTQHIIDPFVLEKEREHTPEEIYKRDMSWLSQSAALIAEVSTPSLGVGYEIACALNLSRPVLCLYKKDLFLSRMILGNSSPLIVVEGYDTDTEWKATIDRFLSDFDIDIEEQGDI